MTERTQNTGGSGPETLAPVRLFGRTVAYRHYALFILTAIYVLNYMDRQILSILLQPIKEHFQVSDSLLGLLSGFSFALFYATLGIPIAMLADRLNRRNVIAVSLAIFSLMTVLCGMAVQFWHLMLARIGVGIGEAGTSPPSHSIIADLYPEEKRATALAIFALGVNIGIMFGFFGAGLINEFYGWRVAFVLAGVPGILLAIALPFIMREPPRGFSEANRTKVQDAPPFMTVVRTLFKQRTFVHLSLAGALNAFVGYGAVAWTPAFLIRSHGMSTAEIGLILSLMYGVVGGAGTFFGGYLADKLASRNPRWRLWVPALGIFISAPFSVGFYLYPDTAIALAFYLVPALMGAIYLGPAFAITQGLAPLRMRSAAAAMFLFILNIIGLGFGPWAVGAVSDMLQPSFGADSLRWSLLVISVVAIWSGIHFVLAARTMVADMKAVKDLESGTA